MHHDLFIPFTLDFANRITIVLYIVYTGQIQLYEIERIILFTHEYMELVICIINIIMRISYI